MADFGQAFEHTMDFEDRHRTGKVTFDAGGKTRFGIAQKFHPEVPENFWTDPVEEALPVAEEIYREQYWVPLHFEEIEDQSIANKLFDMAVNMGIHQAVTLAQRAANSLLPVPLEVDGKLGSASLAAINSLDPDRLHDMLREFCKAFYQHIAANNPAQTVNLAGWLNRNEQA